MFHSRTFRSIVILIVALVFASTVYAMAASNTLPADVKAGDGSSAISGFEVTDVSYNLDSGTPSNIASADLTFDSNDPAPSTVIAILDSEQSTCNKDAVNDYLWNCPFTTVTAYDAATLRVIATE